MIPVPHTLQTTVRHFLVILAGYLPIQFDEPQLALLSASVAGIIAVAWSTWQAKRNAPVAK